MLPSAKSPCTHTGVSAHSGPSTGFAERRPDSALAYVERLFDTGLMVAGEPSRALRSVDAAGSPVPSPVPSPDRMAEDARSERLVRLRALAGDLSPLTLAQDRCLPVLSALEPVLPGGLQRGTTVVLDGPGTTALAHAVLAGPTRAGSWAACVGVASMGWAAAAEMGVALERVAVVRSDERRAPQVFAALVDAFDVVVIGDEHRPAQSEIRRLQSRARERGAVLLHLACPASGPWGHGHRNREQHSDGWGADVRLECGAPTWSGVGQGWGHLVTRRTTVTVRGRRGFDRPQRVDLWLPGPDGVAVADVATIAGRRVG